VALLTACGGGQTGLSVAAAIGAGGRPAAGATPTAGSRQGPAGDAFYTPPSPLPAGPHGTLIWQRPYVGGAAVTGATNMLLLYTQEGIGGQPVATSGVLAVPKGTPPPGGWPVVTWGHGTAGIADACAPSRTGGHAARDANGQLLARWIAAGYAVVLSDFEGLGTPGIHPYLVGVSEGRSMLDIVRAARQANRALGTRVIVAGHSQGGHAALWAASLASSYTPEITIEATVAFAPSSHKAAVLAGIRGGVVMGSPTTFVMALRGADVADPALGVGGLLGPQAQPYWSATLSKCLAALGSMGAVPTGGQLFRPGADLGALTAELTRNDPGQLRIPGPVLLLQGLDDDTVLPAFTQQLATSLTGVGDQVTLRAYPGATHTGVSAAGADDATAFLRAHLASAS
jgi:dienelactone hydrolase